MRRRRHTALGTAHIGNDRIRFYVSGDGVHHALHGAQGDGEHDHFRIRHRTRRVLFITIDDPELHGALQLRLITAATHHLGAIGGMLQRPRQRTAYQSHTDDA